MKLKTKQVKSEENEGMSHVQEKGKKNKNGRGNRSLATIQNCGVEGEWEKKKLLKKCFWLKYYSPHYMIFLAFFQDKFHFLLKESGPTPQSGSAGEEVQGWQWHNVFLPNYFSVITCSTLSSSAQHLPKTNPAASRQDGGNHFSPHLKKKKALFIYIKSLEVESHYFIFYNPEKISIWKAGAGSEKKKK